MKSSLQKVLFNTVVKPPLIVLSGALMGLAFGILPCYVFPLFGGTKREWCGFKSEPPHFGLQFWIGFSMTIVAGCYVGYVKKPWKPDRRLSR